MRILIVEDDELVADAIARGLRAAGYVIDRVGSAEAAASLLGTEKFDLAVLDIGLPGLDGLGLVQRLRAAGNALPLLILTARDTLDDRVRALDLGSDDFLAKPFETAELVARCRALLRRANVALHDTLTIDRMVLNLAGKRLRIDNAEVELTAREWLVLEALTRNIGRIVSKEQLLQAVSSLEQSVSPNAVEVYVSRLRSKLGDAAMIRSLRGMGYRLEESRRS